MTSMSYREIAGYPVWRLVTVATVLVMYYVGLLYAIPVAEWTWSMTSSHYTGTSMQWGALIGWAMGAGTVLVGVLWGHKMISIFQRNEDQEADDV